MWIKYIFCSPFFSHNTPCWNCLGMALTSQATLDASLHSNQLRAGVLDSDSSLLHHGAPLPLWCLREGILGFVPVPPASCQHPTL